MAKGIFFTRRVKSKSISSLTSCDEIIKGKLYIGNLQAAQDIELLESLNITHILNASSQAPKFPNHFEYLSFHVADGDAKIKEHFRSAARFIDEGEVVLVHCRQGISRSSTLSIAYLMLHHDKTLDEALKQVKAARPIIKPHPNLMEELKVLNAELHPECVEPSMRSSHYHLRSRERPRV